MSKMGKTTSPLSRSVRRSYRVLLTVVSAGLGFWTAGALFGNQAAQEPSDVSQRVAAIVNGEPISEAEVAAGIRALAGGEAGAQSAAAPDAPPPQPETPAPGLRDQVIDMIVGSRLIEQFVAQQQITVEPKEVDDFITRMRQNAEKGGGSFVDILKTQGQTEEDLRRRIAGMLGWQKYVQSRATDEILKKYFEENRRQFDGTQVRVSQILLKVPDEAGKEQLEALLEKLRDVRRRVVDKETTFAEAAGKYSESPSARRGGDLGFMPRRRRMYEPFARAAFELKVGEVSEPVLTPQGLHLITVTDVKAGDKKFDDVRQEVQRAYAQQLEADVTAEQREKAKIEIPGRQTESEAPRPQP